MKTLINIYHIVDGMLTFLAAMICLVCGFRYFMINDPSKTWIDLLCTIPENNVWMIAYVMFWCGVTCIFKIIKKFENFKKIENEKL